VVILLCVRWYLRYSLTYRDQEEIMANGTSILTTGRFGAGSSGMQLF
jgi:hypothetical protein